VAAALRGEGVIDFMQDILSEDQMRGLIEFQEKKKVSKIESKALKDFAKLQQSIDLSDEQKDEVYTLLYDDVEKSLNSQSDADFVTQSMMSSMGVDLGMGELDMNSIMSGTDGEEAPRNRADILQRIKESHQNKIDRKVAHLAPVLNETQQQQYRKSLESKGSMLQMLLKGATITTEQPK